MMAITGQMIKGPIQGENLTVNSKNYAWHRPPQYSNFDDAFRHFVDTAISDTERFQSGMTLAVGGVPATTAISSLLITMVNDGRISPDMSLLLAGPAYKVFTRMLDIAGVEYLNGFESPKDTAEFYRMLKEQGSLPSKKIPLPKEVEKETQEISEEVSDIPVGGLMGARSDEDTVEMDLESTPTNLIEEEATDESR
jgi:hypothetical protein